MQAAAGEAALRVTRSMWGIAGRFRLSKRGGIDANNP